MPEPLHGSSGTPSRSSEVPVRSSEVPVLDRLHSLLDALGLKEADQVLEAHLERSASQESSYAEMLCELLFDEVTARRDRNLATRIKLSHLPFRKTLEQFDFKFQPSIDERQIRELKTLRFAHDASNVIFLGPPGVGKTHLSVGLAMEALRAGMSAYFITAHDLIDDLSTAAREGRLSKRWQVYLRPKVLIIDEMGYLPMGELGGKLFFQLVSARYERGSLLLTSNKSYGDWGGVFADPVIASAILDRLLHHSTTINIRGESYRLKERKRTGTLSFPPPHPVATSAAFPIPSASSDALTQRSEHERSEHERSGSEPEEGAKKQKPPGEKAGGALPSQSQTWDE
jgi:DNA replication protein DnaC